jgi:dihydrofolate reductase
MDAAGAAQSYRYLAKGAAMASLIYSTIMSLDGYVADRRGNFDWAEPDEEVHTFINDLQRAVGTYLYGRQMYEVMLAWEDLRTTDQPGFIRDFAKMWGAADKIVYSSTLEAVTSRRTRIERHFEPEAVLQMKERLNRGICVGGPGLAAHAFRAGLVDECQLFIAPIIVGGGKHAFPKDIQLRLNLEKEHRFENGAVYLDYRGIA